MPSYQKHWFQKLDQWDLDDVLRNLNERGLSQRRHVSVEPATTHAGK